MFKPVNLDRVTSFFWNSADDVLHDPRLLGKARDAIVRAMVPRRVVDLPQPITAAALPVRTHPDRARVSNHD